MPSRKYTQEWYGLREELRQVVGFPVPMNPDDEFQLPLRRTLEALWIQWVEEYPNQIRSEGDLITDLASTDLEDFGGDVVELRADLTNLKTWIGDAEAAFAKAIRVLGWTKYKSPADRIKHWPRRFLSDAAVRQATERGDSMFRSIVTEGLLLRFFWLIMSKRTQEFLDGSRDTFYFDVDVNQPLGASKGVDTPYIVFKLDYNTPEVHAYPIPFSEIPSGEPIDRLSEWCESATT